MKAQCPSCGQWLELPARAATCPNCGTLVTIPVAPPAPPGRAFQPEPDVSYERPAPYEPPREEGMPQWLRSLILLGIIGFVTFAVIFIAIWKISSKLNQSTVATPAPTIAPPTSTRP